MPRSVQSTQTHRSVLDGAYGTAPAVPAEYAELTRPLANRYTTDRSAPHPRGHQEAPSRSPEAPQFPHKLVCTTPSPRSPSSLRRAAVRFGAVAPRPRTPSGALLSPTSKAMWSAQSGPQGRSQLEPFPLWPSVPDVLFKPDSILTNSQVSRGQPSIRRTARRIAYEDLANLNLMF